MGGAVQRHAEQAPGTLLRRQHGFTLVEVLIALALMAVMGGLSWQGLDSLLRSRSAVQAEHARSTVLGTVLAQWRADLNAATVLPGQGLGSGIDWDGRVLRITRRSTEVNPDGSDTGVWVVAWRWQAQASQTHGPWQRRRDSKFLACAFGAVSDGVMRLSCDFDSSYKSKIF